RIEKLHIIGGGSQNELLNQYTANAIGLPVAAGPSEATALGNNLVQAKAMGLVDSLWDLRKIVRNSVEMSHFSPMDAASWEAQKSRFAQLPL
ncbi:MAG: FGGY-family carbohydrate kinase, partial [Bacteroidales bacterium]